MLLCYLDIIQKGQHAKPAINRPGLRSSSDLDHAFGPRGNNHLNSRPPAAITGLLASWSTCSSPRCFTWLGWLINTKTIRHVAVPCVVLNYHAVHLVGCGSYCPQRSMVGMADCRGHTDGIANYSGLVRPQQSSFSRVF